MHEKVSALDTMLVTVFCLQTVFEFDEKISVAVMLVVLNMGSLDKSVGFKIGVLSKKVVAWLAWSSLTAV
jgi:hypothetical protein